MIVKRGFGDLNKIYRPCTIDEVIGHETIKRTIKNAIEKRTLPHAMLFTGPSGCGKTTFARIIALCLECKEGPTSTPCCKCDSCRSILNLNSFAVTELDAARTSDVATVRRVIDELSAGAISGEPYKIAIFDEAHELSGKAEDALLKILEDTPKHVYIILCTNLAGKLKEVTRNRCKITQFGRLLDSEIYSLLEQVSQFEGFDYKKEVLNYVVEESSGVPRAALSFLQQIASEGSWTKEAASIIINAGVDIDHAGVFDFCKYVLKNPNFKAVVQEYKKIKQVPIDTVRINLCGFFVGCLKNARRVGDAEKYSNIIDLLNTAFSNYPKPEHTLINNLFKITQILKS